MEQRCQIIYDEFYEVSRSHLAFDGVRSRLKYLWLYTCWAPRLFKASLVFPKTNRILLPCLQF